MAISKTPWPIPFHHNCRCRQTLVVPNATAEPFVDFREILDGLDESQKTAAIGKSAYKLLTKGVVSWDEVVTPSRVRTLEEVVARRKLTVATMEKAGVRRSIAERAWGAVHTPEHELVNAHRTALINNLQGAGLSTAQIKQAFGERMAQRISIETPSSEEGGSPTRTVVGPRRPTPWPTLAPQLIAGLRLNDKAKAAMRAAEDRPETFGPSKAKAEIRDGVPIGPDYASLVGAPDDAKVTVIPARGTDGYINARGDGYEIRADIHGDTLKLTLMQVDANRQGAGLGTRALGRSIEAARKAGMKAITLDASADGDDVGYKVWPKLGFDGPIPEAVRGELPAPLAGSRTLGDLYATKAGREWWEANGVTVPLSFDLDPRSRDSRVWDEYLRQRGKGKG